MCGAGEHSPAPNIPEADIREFLEKKVTENRHGPRQQRVRAKEEIRKRVSKLHFEPIESVLMKTSKWFALASIADR